jgi:hypothetical protein
MSIEAELEAESIIALWLMIHGGDPPPGEISGEIAARAAWQVVNALAQYAEETVITEQSAKDARKKGASAGVIIERLNRIGCKVSIRKAGGHQEIKPDNLLLSQPGEPQPPRCYCFTWEGRSSCYCLKKPIYQV